jgi:hypothetical protein
MPPRLEQTDREHHEETPDERIRRNDEDLAGLADAAEVDDRNEQQDAETD